MFSLDSMFRTLDTREEYGTPRCMNKMSTGELQQHEDRIANTARELADRAKSQGESMSLDAEQAIRKMDAFFRNYGGLPSGCLDHRTREEIARSNQVELDDSNSVKVGTIYTHPKTLKQYWIPVSRPLGPKPHKIRWGYKEVFDPETGEAQARFYTK